MIIRRICRVEIIFVNRVIKNKTDMKKAKARHMLVDSEASCNDLKTKIASGEDFAKLAKKHSRWPSGKSDGDLGEFSPG